MVLIERNSLQHNRILLGHHPVLPHTQVRGLQDPFPPTPLTGNVSGSQPFSSSLSPDLSFAWDSKLKLVLSVKIMDPSVQRESRSSLTMEASTRHVFQGLSPGLGARTPGFWLCFSLRVGGKGYLFCNTEQQKGITSQLRMLGPKSTCLQGWQFAGNLWLILSYALWFIAASPPSLPLCLHGILHVCSSGPKCPLFKETSHIGSRLPS